MLSLDPFEPFVSILALGLPDPSEFLCPSKLILIPGLLFPESAVLVDQLVQHTLQLVTSSRTLRNLITDLSYLTLSVSYSRFFFLYLIVEALIVPRVGIYYGLLISRLLM